MYEPMYQGYGGPTSSSSSRGSSGRLPPIHAIGRAQVVDEDEPPDVPIEAYGFDSMMDGGGCSISSVESVFEPSDAEEACKLLRKGFHMLGPGRHACKRNPDHGGSHFVHCKRGVRLGAYYSRLSRLLEERAWLEVSRDCAYRLHGASVFLEELEGLLNAEYRTAYAIRHGCALDTPVSKLYCLNALCEDLRVHVGHWNSVKQRVCTSRWLRPELGFLCRDLRAVQRTFARICDRAIFVVDRLVHLGFEVLAHCDLAGLTPDILWNITRGLEDFNNIVSTYRSHAYAYVEGGHHKHYHHHPSSSSSSSHHHSHNPGPDPSSSQSPAHQPPHLSHPHPHPQPLPYLHPAACSSLGLSEGVRSIPFHKVLAILANERSRYAAQLTHRFFTASEAFSAALQPGPAPPTPFQWDEDAAGSTVNAIHLQAQGLTARDGGPSPEPVRGPRLVSREGGSSSPEPSTYRGGGLSLSQQDSCDVRGSQASLSGAFLHIGHLRVPDLSSLPSPLVEFSASEQQFADLFLQIVCSSTSLLRKNNNSGHSRSSRSSKHPRPDFKAPPMSPVVGRPPKNMQGETPVLSRTDSRRKTVSWGDNADSSIRSQVVAMYMSVLWQHFGRNLDLFLDEPAWAGKVGLLQSGMGTVLLYGDTAIAMLRHMMEHICMKAKSLRTSKHKDMFPPGSISALLGVVVRLHALSAFAAWDTFMIGAKSLQTTDKCYPHLVGEGQYSTHCGHQLRSAHRPLLSMLQELCRSVPQSQHESVDLLPQYDLDLSLLSGVSCRLLVSCLSSHGWCTTKLHHMLASGNVKTYLFVANTDLGMLRDSGQRAVQLVQTLTSAVPTSSHTSVLDQLSLAHTSEAALQCSLLTTQLQNLEGSALGHFTDKFGQQASAFFTNHLPPAKAWRRKVPAEFPEDASSYVGELWEGLVSPVVEGVARLSVSAQLEILTAVVTRVCTAWTQAFLRDKTKFSLHGAQQLGVDVESIRGRLSAPPLAPPVGRALPELPVVRQLGGVVHLLKRQPPRPASRFRDCSTEDLSCETREANPSPSTSRSELPASMEDSQDSRDVCLVTNADQWLALRLIGGSRAWRFPSCFGAGASQR